MCTHGLSAPVWDQTQTDPLPCARGLNLTQIRRLNPSRIFVALVLDSIALDLTLDFTSNCNSGNRTLKMAQMKPIYEFTTALRGFHVYRCECKPYLNQPIKFKRELDNPYDRFAVARKIKLPGKLRAVIIGHVPREMSRHVWYAIREGTKFSVMVRSVTPRPSPLLQGGPESIITMTAKWQSSKGRP